MKDWKITSNIVPALKELGIEAPSDIIDLEPNDVEELIVNTGLKKVEANRFRKKYNEMVGTTATTVTTQQHGTNQQDVETKEDNNTKEENDTQCPEWGTGIIGLIYLGAGIAIAVIASGKSEAASEPCKSLDNQRLPQAEANVRLCYFLFVVSRLFFYYFFCYKLKHFL